MQNPEIKIDTAAFLRDGGDPVGAVRQVSPGGRAEIVLYVENAGDFVVPMTAVKAVHFDKVILEAALLSPKLRAAIGHAHDAETLYADDSPDP